MEACFTYLKTWSTDLYSLTVESDPYFYFIEPAPYLHSLTSALDSDYAYFHPLVPPFDSNYFPHTSL